MLLVRGFIEDESGLAENASFKSYYLTLAYSLKSEKTETSSELLKKNKKFLLNSISAKNYSNEEITDLNNKKLSLNVIKNIRDISGYEDERKSEKISTKLKNSLAQDSQRANFLENVTRIEVAPSGEFVIQLSKEIDDESKLLVSVYSPNGDFLKEFSFSYKDLQKLALDEEDLKLSLNTKVKSFTRRQFQTKPSTEIQVNGTVTSLAANEVPEGLLLVLWASSQACERFDQSKFTAIAITRTQEKGFFSLKYSSKESYKTVYISLTTDKILAKRIPLNASGEINSPLNIIFKSISTKTLKDENNLSSEKNVIEEFFYYYAVRTSHIGFEDQVNSSNFIKAISCFDQASELEMKQVGHGHVLVIKESLFSDAEQNFDLEYIYSLSGSAFDEKFSNFYIGGTGFALNTANPNRRFDKAYSAQILKRAYAFIEEKLKSSSLKQKLSFRSRSLLKATLRQELFDVREVLFIPVELSKFDLNELLMYKDVIEGKLLNKEYEVLLRNLKAFSEDNVDLDIDNLLLHINQNLDYYHHLIWYGMKANRRFALLDNCISPNTNGKSIASVVENKILGMLGNSIIMPVSVGFNFDPCIKLNDGESLKDFYAEHKLSSKFSLSLPSV